MIPACNGLHVHYSVKKVQSFWFQNQVRAVKTCFYHWKKKKKENVQGDQSQAFELLSQNFNYPIQTFEYAEILR